VLVAVLHPGDGFPGDRIEALRRTGLELLRTAGGDAEPLGDDGVAAVFDDPGAGLEAASRLHRQAAEGSQGAAWRAGLHVCDVVMSAEMAASLAAVERAEALSGLAHPGTTAVAAGELPALGSLRGMDVRPLDAGTLPGEPGARVVLLAPGRPVHPALARRRLLLLAGTAALGGAGAVAWLATRGRRERTSPLGGGDVAGEHLTLGVGPFRTSGLEPGREWIAVALRDGLNTQLTELSAVRVFSEEFIDFVMTREGLTAIEVANRLGIKKMVTGTVLSVGDRVRVEARIVDIASGLLEGGAEASGEARDYLALESEVVLGVIQRLGIPLSAQDEHRMAARRTSDPDALRRFLRAEPEPEPSHQPEPGHGPDEPSSGWEGFGEATAWADEASAAVAAFLEEYRQATEARDTTRLAAMYEEFSPEQREGLERYFQGVRNLRVALEHVDIVVIGDEAVSSYTRNDDFVDVSTGRPQHVTSRLTRKLRRMDGRWRFAAGR
jgi:TolB-like protein/ketosteroid isomerase-like protein